jgi:hypothetical protein
VLDSNPVSQLHLVLVARASAVCFVRPRREHRAEDAVLHVKHGHVLVHDHFKHRRGRRLDQFEQLLSVEIVRRSHPQGALLAQVVHRQLVGGIQGKVVDTALAFSRA